MNEEKMLKRKKWIVHGRVQGVGFRLYTSLTADKLGINGYVKNQDDDTVLVVAEARETRLRAFEQWLHKGPEFAKVTQVVEQPIDNGEIFTHFDIR